MAQKAKFDIDHAEKATPRLKEFPFDSDRKRMGTVHQHDDHTLSACVKGSLSDLLPQCTTVQVNGVVRPITDDDREKKSTPPTPNMPRWACGV